MTGALAAGLLGCVLATSIISGVFGMAGGVLLMGALTLALPVSAAMVTHGIVQIAANGARAVLHRRHVAWGVVARYGLGAAVGTAAAAGLVVLGRPSKGVVLVCLGALPALLWAPRAWVHLDAARPLHAVAAGAGVTGLNSLAGVAGPLLDLFFVRTALTRHAVVATKAATQVLAHFGKIIVWGLPAVAGAPGPPAWFFALAIPLTFLGAAIGGRILAALTDQSFQAWTRGIITAMGAAFLIEGLRLLARGG